MIMCFTLYKWYGVSPSESDCRINPTLNTSTATITGVPSSSVPFLDIISPALTKQIIEGRDVNLAGLLMKDYESVQAASTLLTSSGLEINLPGKKDILLHRTLTIKEFLTFYRLNLATVKNSFRREQKLWIWSSRHQDAFDELKRLLASAKMLAHYNSNAATETHVIVDASPVGLGAILRQKQSDGNFRPVTFASRTLNDVEQRYSQTEREVLAVVWGCERFHLYLYGKEFILVTDHKPLEVIYSPKSKPPARIERWAMRLQPYTFKVTCKMQQTAFRDCRKFKMRLQVEILQRSMLIS
ncbi:Hypothetical predicted protein [Mytilus galloprovincialis]|uniref:Reverse transcriptase RNase H-like domain-containing protein n=1 Tax=Mytilus galloprovincialis TaxID=29158 RepID=A0A8B6EZI7_MYTGA|nr:Hypothetical predicted protein [Mytilus galloprovincialis]